MSGPLRRLTTPSVARGPHPLPGLFR
jgi:hypothetical protein